MKLSTICRAFVTTFAATNLAGGIAGKDIVLIVAGAVALGIRELLRE